jgi:hypothetical protein
MTRSSFSAVTVATVAMDLGPWAQGYHQWCLRGILDGSSPINPIENIRTPLDDQRCAEFTHKGLKWVEMGWKLQNSVNRHSPVWKNISIMSRLKLNVLANLDASIQSLSLPTKWPSTSGWEAMISQAEMHKCSPEWFWNNSHLNDRSAYAKSHQHAQVMNIGHHWASLCNVPGLCTICALPSLNGHRRQH